MNDTPNESQSPQAAQTTQTNQTGGASDTSERLSPLPGETGIPNIAAERKPTLDKKGLLAIACVVITLVAFLVASAKNIFKDDTPSDASASRSSDRPSAAAGDTRKLDFSSPAASQTQRIPALIPNADELAEPVGVRRTGSNVAASNTPHKTEPGSGTRTPSPEDAPVMLVSSRISAGLNKTSNAIGHAMPTPEPANLDASGETADPLQATKRNLQAYQQQLQGMLDTLTRSTALTSGQDAPPGIDSGNPATPNPQSPARHAAPSSGLFGGQLQGSETPSVVASQLGNRSLTLPKGTAFTCALKTRIISAASGLVGCQVQRHVFSEDGKVLLLERGSHMDGEYRIMSLRPGMIRIPVLWTRIRTPLGVTVDIDSPGTGPLGESGVDGYMDKRWGERIGAAVLMSLIDDSVKLIIQNQSQQSNLDGSSTVILPSATANSSKLAEKVLDSTINIPPLIYQNQGGIVGIYVARDLDFSSVYALRAVQE